MGQEIMFEAFCDRYQNTYVGDLLSGKILKPSRWNKSTSCLVSLKCSIGIIAPTSWLRFKKMVDYTQLLSDDATKWSVLYFFDK